MEIIKFIIEFIFHIDKHLYVVINNFGVWSYALLFAIIFAETGLVVTPFLPGDSLLFTVGAFAAAGFFHIGWLFTVLVIAAIAGDSINYAIGKRIGDKVFHQNNSRIFRKEYLDRTHRFFEKYGGKAIILARFVPVIRTFAPFLAGVGKMNYGRFLLYNVTGGVLWVSAFVLCGFYFGNTPFVKNNFSMVVWIIIFVSILPAVIEVLKHKMKPANG